MCCAQGIKGPAPESVHQSNEAVYYVGFTSARCHVYAHPLVQVKPSVLDPPDAKLLEDSNQEPEDATERRLASMENRITAMDTRFQKLQDQFSQLEEQIRSRFEQLESTLGTHLLRTQDAMQKLTDSLARSGT